MLQYNAKRMLPLPLLLLLLLTTELLRPEVVVSTSAVGAENNGMSAAFTAV